MKKTPSNLLLLGLTVLFIAGCNGRKAQETRIAQLTDSITLLQDSIAHLNTQLDKHKSHTSVSDKSYIGTYKVVDVKGQTFYFLLNDDETAQITQEGSEEVWYCSLKDYRDIRHGLTINFSDRRPWIWFNDGVKEFGSMHIDDGWLYANLSTLKSKHPRWRLQVEKID
ncbi:MAG: hypothetical protein ILA34_07415 [Bacteroidaceae bacterium]|nr:hypothetical protein [Bacteroidaceae bacterium]